MVINKVLFKIEEFQQIQVQIFRAKGLDIDILKRLERTFNWRQVTCIIRDNKNIFCLQMFLRIFVCKIYGHAYKEKKEFREIYII